MQAGRVRRIVVDAIDRAVFEGETFGDVGRYEQVRGRAFCEVDPRHPLNTPINRLATAPRNAAGHAEYAFDFHILKPADPQRSNGWLLYDFPNRGDKLAISRFNQTPADNQLDRKEHAGDGLLMRRGFTVVWTAWQGGVASRNHRLIADLPIARSDDGPVTGRSRDEFIIESSVYIDTVSEVSESRFVARLTYPAATLVPSDAILTIRQFERDPRSSPPDLAWRYLDDKHIEVARPAGFDLGAIFEFVYTARHPTIMGLGLTGVRDFVSFLRHDESDGNPLGEARPFIRRAMAFGASQSGRVLRDFLYLGLNEDSAGRPVFDAMLPTVTGSRKSLVNTPFAQPGRFSRQHEEHAYGGDQFPFTYGPLRDPISGRAGGILERAIEANACPKIIHLDTESDLWAGRSSLLATDCAGEDIDLPDNVRLYMASGVPHSAAPPMESITALPDNRLSYSPALRALLIALVEWVDEGLEPPPTQFPSRASRSLVEIETARAGFPAIPGCPFPASLNRLWLLDESVEPPVEGPEYPVLVAATDADGNSLDGVRHPLLEAPIATLTGWNLRAPGFAPGELYSVAGAVIPFARTAAERTARGDPRLSLEERYGSEAAWAAALADAAQRLVAQRLLLPEDAEQMTRAAQKGWAIENFW